MNGKIANNNKGVVSLLVTFIFIIMIGLIIVGFAEITRSQGSQTLNNQLSSGSYYAASSGINEIENNFLKGNKSICGIGVPTPCLSPSCCPVTTSCGLSFASNNSSQITCYSFNNTPSTLTVKLNTSQGKLIHINPIKVGVDSNFILSFELDSSPGYTNSSCPYVGDIASTNKHVYNFFVFSFNEYNNGLCSPGIVRADLSQGPSASVNTGQALANNSRTIFMIPTSKKHTEQRDFIKPLISPTTKSPLTIYSEQSTTTKSGVDISCTYTTNYCEWINLRSIYAPMTITITAIGSSSGQVNNFKDSQATIDVTAKSQNVVRRLLATVNTSPIPTQVPNFGIQTTDSICKLLSIDNASGSINHSSFSYSFPGDTDSSDCQFSY